MSDISFGVLLPHFNERRPATELIENARVAEDLGFGSVWVRDHLFIPDAHRIHGGIAESGFITEPLSTLAAISAVTSTIRLGTAVVIPHRHPVELAQILGTLSYLSSDRIICGIGAGANKEEFAAVGVDFDSRFDLVRQTIEQCRSAWRGAAAEPAGSAPAVSVNPAPSAPLPFWYGGLSAAAMRRAVDWCDGWLPSRLPLTRLEPLVARCWESVKGKGANDFVIATMPQVAIADTADEALEQFDRNHVAAEAQRLLGKTIDGSDPHALKGMILWGTAADICRHVERYIELGVSHLIFDLRSSFDRLVPTMRQLATGVLSNF